MYKMLVLDLDGTLLNDEKNIPEENIRAINKLYEDFGVIPVIATARPLEVAKFIAKQGGEAFEKYIIATNGAILWEAESGETVSRSLSKEQIMSLVKVCEESSLEYEFMTTKCEVADSKYSYRRTIDPMYDNMGIPFNYQSNMREYILGQACPIPLFAVNGTEEELQIAMKELQDIQGLQISDLCTRTTPEKDPEGKIKTLGYFDIMKEGVTKASAIEMLAKKLGIDKKEIIAIGDGGNDKEMLEAVGLKVAMKNAKPSLKEIADVITPVDNNEGGVGRFVNVLHRQLEKEQERNSEHLTDEESFASMEEEYL